MITSHQVAGSLRDRAPKVVKLLGLDAVEEVAHEALWQAVAVDWTEHHARNYPADFAAEFARLLPFYASRKLRDVGAVVDGGQCWDCGGTGLK